MSRSTIIVVFLTAFVGLAHPKLTVDLPEVVVAHEGETVTFDTSWFTDAQDFVSLVWTEKANAGVHSLEEPVYEYILKNRDTHATPGWRFPGTMTRYSRTLVSLVITSFSPEDARVKCITIHVRKPDQEVKHCTRVEFHERNTSTDSLFDYDALITPLEVIYQHGDILTCSFSKPPTPEYYIWMNLTDVGQYTILKQGPAANTFVIPDDWHEDELYSIQCLNHHDQISHLDHDHFTLYRVYFMVGEDQTFIPGSKMLYDIGGEQDPLFVDRNPPSGNMYLLWILIGSSVGAVALISIVALVTVLIIKTRRPKQASEQQKMPVAIGINRVITKSVVTDQHLL